MSNNTATRPITIVKYDFPENPSASGYCVFPAALEEDGLVLFHATPIENQETIFREGFQIPDPTGDRGLPSVSFGKRSISALTHAMFMRRTRPGAYCIIAVRYSSLERNGLKVNASDIHDYTLDPAPEIIGFCVVPETYEHR